MAQESFTYNPVGDIEWRDQASAAQMHEPDQPFPQTYQSGAVNRRGQFSYQHDLCGRMIMRTEYRNGFRPQTTRFTWDGFNRLVQVHTGDGAIWRYSYDAFGRRTGKRCLTQPTSGAYHNPARHLQQETCLWQGAVLAEQSKTYADGSQEILTWHYAPDSFTPLALTQKRAGQEAQLLYFVTDQLGTPRELVDAEGQIVWSAQLQTWGRANQWWPVRAANDANNVPDVDLRFANQWYDAETGMHYNFQRYYDPDTGQYCSPDPIGVAGGLRQQGYVHDPSGWVDPLGLSGCGEIFHNQLPGRLAAELAAARKAGMQPIKFSDPNFDSVINQGPIKFVVLPDGELIIGPHTLNSIEISHAVLSNGKPVIAAGEANIAGSNGNYFGLELRPHSGHFLNGASSAQNSTVTSISRQVFGEIGIIFL